ncbi:glycosyltransferase [Aurantiacibacter flavus]|uniref:Glycosyltransferase n=1 Tax=Aurantiacibacter flavus TaxID=3145232 RepID=A0ABV0CTS5_9SPHN
MNKNVRKRIALSPVSTESNAFCNLFTQAVEQAGMQPVPYQWGLRDLSGTDAVIFHWPDRFLRPDDPYTTAQQLWRLLLLRKTHGLKLVWVAHNVAPHDGADSRSVLRSMFLGALDGIIYLSQRSRDLVRERYDVPRHVIEQLTVHGSYPGSSTPFLPPEPGMPVSIASVGLVRPYKNLEELVEAARALDPAKVDVRIAGKRHDAGYAAELESMAGPGGAIRFDLRDTLLSEAEMEAAIDAAHGVVLPYRNILNSGSAIHALSRGRPVLVPALGSMPELAQLVGEDWVRLYDGALSAPTLADFAAHIRRLPASAKPNLSPLSWDRVKRDLDEFFEQLFAQRR